METMESVNLKLDYNRDYYTYQFDWNLECDKEYHKNFLIDYSKLTGQSVFPSGKRFCKAGVFVGCDKYFEFFLVVRRELDIIMKISYPNKTEGGFCETYGILSATVQPKYHNGNIMDGFFYKFYEIHATIAYDMIPEEADNQSEESSHTTVVWLQGQPNYSNGSGPISPENFGCLTFRINIEHKLWGPYPVMNFTFANSANPISAQLDTSDLLFSSNYSDLTINCGGKEWVAHKLVLCNKSSVFRAMLNQPMVENITGKLQIEDTEAEIVEEFLWFIYTGSVTNLTRNAEGLFLIAEKYDVQDLKLMSENSILSTISGDNVLERFSLGKLLNSEAIIHRCVDIIKREKKNIWRTENEFSVVCQQYPDLLFKVFV